jgi:hypothetical protein
MSGHLLPVLLVATSTLPAMAGTQPTPATDPLTISIESPHAGIVDGPELRLEASISDPAITEATLTVNGSSYAVPVREGRIDQEILAVPGNNRVGIVVVRGAVVARRSVTFRYRGEPMDLVVLLTWKARGEIIDLWVREPDGETCKWDHRRTKSSGRLLDFSQDAIGFGSQGFVLPAVQAGRYRIKVHYWAASAWNKERHWFELDGELQELDEASGPARDKLIAQLDDWATPAAPQTPVHAEVIAFPGTSQEHRWRFEVVLDRPGKLVTLGEVEISEVMIRSARKEGTP